MNTRTRLRIKWEAWRDSLTFWLAVWSVGVLVVLWLAMRVVS
jgi:hypothetical protein